MIELTDTISTNGTVLVKRGDVAEAIRPWFPDAGRYVSDMITELQARILRDEYHAGLAEFLGLLIHSAD